MALFGKQVSVTPGFLVAQVVTVVLLVLITMASLNFRDISDALAFYGVYHREPMNQLIHFFGVPGILWTVLIVTAHLPVPVLGQHSISLPFLSNHPISWGTVVVTGYILFYIKIDPFGGTLFSFVVYAMYVSAVRLMQNDQKLAQKKTDSVVVSWTGTGRLLLFAGIVHVLCWYIQIHPGHAIFEGAKPAVMDSFGGALSSAPLFAFYEGLWFLGINRGLQEQTQALVSQYTAELCAAGANMRVCSSL